MHHCHHGICYSWLDGYTPLNRLDASLSSRHMLQSVRWQGRANPRKQTHVQHRHRPAAQTDIITSQWVQEEGYHACRRDIEEISPIMSLRNAGSNGARVELSHAGTLVALKSASPFQPSLLNSPPLTQPSPPSPSAHQVSRTVGGDEGATWRERERESKGVGGRISKMQVPYFTIGLRLLRWRRVQIGLPSTGAMQSKRKRYRSHL